jgi:hypothetical protein
LLRETIWRIAENILSILTEILSRILMVSPARRYRRFLAAGQCLSGRY